MTAPAFLRYTFSVSVAAMLTSCGGSQPPIGAGAMPQTSAIATHADRGKSWMLPEASGEDLMYSSLPHYGAVYVLSYPKGKLVGELTGFQDPHGLCVDKSGDVWVAVYGASEVDEYAHSGTSQIASLSVPGGTPYGCAVDPATGNLAVTYGVGGGSGNIAVYSNAQGTPVTYSEGPPFYYCTYDNASNLLISDDWAGARETPHLYELPRGSSSLTEVSFSKTIHFKSNVQAIQWDGKAFAYGGSRVTGNPLVIYQLTISGSEAKLSGTTKLSNSRGGYNSQFWVQGNSVLNDVGGVGRIGLWNYPGGGKPTKLFRMPVSYDAFVAGLAISEAPSRPRIHKQGTTRETH